VTATTILEHFEELIALQDQHHQQSPKWYATIGAKTPDALADMVKANIAETLEDPGLQALRDILSNLLKEISGRAFHSATEMAGELMQKEDALSLLFTARKNILAKLERKGGAIATAQYIRAGVFDILGWLALLAVNTAWLSENRDKLYPEAFPGSIELPVKTDSGIEIIHAALNKRCPRFDIAKGTLYGSNRIPTVDHHHFLESGICTADTVSEIKRAIYIYLNKSWGKDKIPDRFAEDENAELDEQLDWYNKQNEGRYLVVQRSQSDCLLNEEVYKVLKSDLPALQVIFHNAYK
jgi:hypothetical protein